MPNVAHTMHHTVQAVKLNTQMGLGPRTQTHHGDGLWDSFGLGKPPLLQRPSLGPHVDTRHVPWLVLSTPAVSQPFPRWLLRTVQPALGVPGIGWLDGQR